MAAAELNIIMSELSVEDLRLIVSVFKNNTALQAASVSSSSHFSHNFTRQSLPAGVFIPSVSQSLIA